MKKLNLIVFMVFLLVQSACLFSQDIKMRAREHYTNLWVSKGNETQHFKSLSNTISFGWENPYKFSLYCSFSSILTKFSSASDLVGVGNKFRFYNLGYDIKYFPSKSFQMYIRPGIGISLLRPVAEEPNYTGGYAFFGIGYEYPFKKFGLAIEMAGRYASLNSGLSLFSLTPSIGFHFYGLSFKKTRANR